MTALLHLLAERFSRAEILWDMSLREVHEHEHCAYMAARTPVKSAMDDTAGDNDLLAVFRTARQG